MLGQFKQLYSRYTPYEERVVHFLTLGLLLLGSLAILVNRFSAHYTGSLYIIPFWLKLSPLFLMLLVFSTYAEGKASPRLVFFTRIYTLYYFVVIALGLAITGIQYTPFPAIDAVLARIDAWLGFNTPAVMAWTAGHPGLKALFHFAYYAINTEMFLVVFILALFKDRWPIYEFLIAGLSSVLVASCIYYFFPTSAPVSVFHSPYFSSAQQATATKFIEVHQYLSLTTQEGGMIAFPSCHVIWAVLLTYALRSKVWLFCPVALLNGLGALATIFLGWHYLCDLIAALLLVALSVVFSHHVKRKVSIAHDAFDRGGRV